MRNFVHPSRSGNCIETAQHIVIISSEYGSPIILILPLLNFCVKFQRGHPPMGELNTGVVHKFYNFRPISGYNCC